MSPNPAVLTWPARLPGGVELAAQYQAFYEPAGNSPWTTLDVPLGPASPDRRVVVVAHGRTYPIAAVTVGGVALLEHVSNVGAVDKAHIFSGVVPEGTTATVVVTASSSSASRGPFSVYTITGGPSALQEVASASGGDAAVYASATVATAPGDIVIAGGVQYAGDQTLREPVWIGPVVDYFEVLLIQHTSAHAVADSSSMEVAVNWPTSNQIDQLVAATFRGV